MILDDFSLDKCLGKGAFGEVYLATKKGTNKLFATKKIERNSVENDEMIQYFINEVQILKELDHPNIAKFEDIKKTKNHYYIIMEYCNGGELYKTLQKYMQKNNNKPFTQEIVQHLMRQIISAFQYIHRKNIIHRDIKLENILLNYESEQDKNNMNLMKAQVKIIDFGFAAKMDANGLKYTTLGSPVHMDPIILNKLKKRGKKTRKLGYDQKADIWSLGTICYEMLIGKDVFDANDLNELVQKVENGTYSVPTTLSKEVISFLNGMLQYDATSRLTIDQLANHSFLKKNVKDFHSIDMKKVSKKVDKDKETLTINVKKNKSIWAIFNKEDEDKLIKISAQDFDKPINEENNIETKNAALKNSKNNIKPNMQTNIQNNNNNLQKNNMPNFQNNNLQKNNMPNLQNNMQRNNIHNLQNNMQRNNMPNLQNNNMQNIYRTNTQNNNNMKNINNNIQNNNIKNNMPNTNKPNLQNNNIQNNNKNIYQNNNNLQNNNKNIAQNNINKNNLQNNININNINNNINIPRPATANMAYNMAPTYPGMVGAYGYQAVPTMPVQNVVGVPMMAYPQVQQYAAPTGFMYANRGYYQ